MSNLSTLRALSIGIVAFGAASSVTTMASSALAYDVKHTPGGTLVHWETDTVEFGVSPSVDAVAGSRAAIHDAFAAWGAREGAPALDDAGKDIPSAPAYDGKNGVFYMARGYAPAGKALAITVLTYDNVTGRVLDADIVVNGNYSFRVLPATTSGASGAGAASATDGASHGDGADQGDVSAVYDLPHVLAHETGHSLGMNDEYVNGGALMYRYTAPDDAALRGPQLDDLQGISMIYGSTLKASGGCGESRVSPVKPTSRSGSLAFALGVGFVAYVLLRRRDRSEGAAKNARRAATFVSVAAFAIASVPEVSGSSAHAAASAETTTKSHATATVTAARTTSAAGLFRTEMALATTACRVASCPKSATFATWGGTMGNVTQEVDGAYTPVEGDTVDVSFERTPNALAAVSSPIAARDAVLSDVVRVVTRAR